MHVCIYVFSLRSGENNNNNNNDNHHHHQSGSLIGLYLIRIEGGREREMLIPHPSSRQRI